MIPYIRIDYSVIDCLQLMFRPRMTPYLEKWRKCRMNQKTKLIVSVRSFVWSAMVQVRYVLELFHICAWLDVQKFCPVICIAILDQTTLQNRNQWILNHESSGHRVPLQCYPQADRHLDLYIWYNKVLMIQECGVNTQLPSRHMGQIQTSHRLTMNYQTG